MFSSSKTHQPIVQELADYISATPGWREDFDQAIETAKQQAPKPMKFIPDLEHFYDFMDSLQTWVPFEECDGKYIYLQLCTFYFVFDQNAVYCHQTKISPDTANGELSYLSDWLVRYAQKMGEFLDKPESLTPITLKTFWGAPKYRMDDYVQPPGGWKNFNQFFARHVKPECRPIDQTADGIISPADSTYENQWKIDDNSEITVTEVEVKGVKWPISKLLKDSQYGDQFKGGIFMHSFLGPNDYHRMHAPVEGEVLETGLIKGQVYLEVTADKDGYLQPIRGVVPRDEEGIDANDSAGYQFCQMRGLVVLKTKEVGLVAILPIGMAQVSSVKLSVEKGQHVKKGDEIAYFQFGGSDIVMVFQSGRVEITATEDKHYDMGQNIAKALAPQST